MTLTRPRIEYVIFDMDGLLVNTEAISTQVTNEILAAYGVQMTWEIKAGLMGKLERDAAAHLLSFFPDIALTKEDYITQRTIGQDRLWSSVQVLPGVSKLVAHLANKGIPIAIATISKRRNFLLKSANLGEIFRHFGCGVNGKEEMVKLGRDVGDGEGKCVGPEQILERGKGLVFEDAIPGVQAGKRAGMSVVWVPDPNLLAVEYSGERRPDQTLRSMEEFKPEEWGLPPYE
ncbi:HAD-like protein [Gyrodon lividus]|nr:HAD-like protein [Gyrodon lividus]